MIIAGALFDEKDLDKLKKLGVKDSKDLSEKKREFLEDKIKKLAKDFVVVRISANKIDELRNTRNLNRIEIDYMVDIVKTLRPRKVIVDSPEANTEKIKKEILGKIGEIKTKIIAENYADRKYPVVSAASILAKVVRDRSIEALEERLGKEIGKGYSSDERTMKFLKDILKEYKGYPEFVRKSWITSQRLKGEKNQKKLNHFSVKKKTGEKEEDK